MYVVAERDLAVFTLGRLPDGGKIRERAEDLAARLHAPAPRGSHALRRRGEGARNAREQPALRRVDGHARDPVGGRTAAHRVDRPAAGDRAGGGNAASSLAATCTSSARRGRRGSPSGRASAPRRRSATFDELARRAARGASTPGASPICSRATSPRSVSLQRRQPLLACSRAGMPTPWASRARTVRCSSPTRANATSCGRRVCGRARSSWRGRSSARGAAPSGR